MADMTALLEDLQATTAQVGQHLAHAEPIPEGTVAGAQLAVIAVPVGFAPTVVLADPDGRVAVWKPSSITGPAPRLGDVLLVNGGRCTHVKQVYVRTGTGQVTLPRVERLTYTVAQ